MFNESDNQDNKIEQSEPLLKSERTLSPLPLWKRIYLFLVGSIGVIVIGLFITLALFSLPQNYQIALGQNLSYVILFVALTAIFIGDLPRVLVELKKLHSYFYGFLIGLAIIGITSAYTNFVNLFYSYEVSDNETTLRNIITLYPAFSIIVMGILGPICEELTYRVGLFGLVKKYNLILAFVLSTLVFAFAHFGFTSKTIINELVNLPVYVFSGFLLTFAYHKYGFVGSTTAHMTNNLVSVIIVTISILNNK